MKSGAVIEQIARVRSAAFDKTGTLTTGAPRLLRMTPDEPQLLSLAAALELRSA